MKRSDKGQVLVLVALAIFVLLGLRPSGSTWGSCIAFDTNSSAARTRARWRAPPRSRRGTGMIPACIDQSPRHCGRPREGVRLKRQGGPDDTESGQRGGRLLSLAGPDRGGHIPYRGPLFRADLRDVEPVDHRARRGGGQGGRPAGSYELHQALGDPRSMERHSEPTRAWKWSSSTQRALGSGPPPEEVYVTTNLDGTWDPRCIDPSVPIGMCPGTQMTLKIGSPSSDNTSPSGQQTSGQFFIIQGNLGGETFQGANRYRNSSFGRAVSRSILIRSLSI